MAKTVFYARQDGVQFFMNTESSSPNTRHRNRFRLFRTENHGRDKSGWIQVGSIAGQELMATQSERDRFEACEKLFANKRPYRYGQYGAIRGEPGKWEGEAFPLRVTHGRDAQEAQSKVGS